MKLFLKSSAFLGLVTAAGLLQAPHASAQTLYWAGAANDPTFGGDGTWDVGGTAHWSTTYPANSTTVWTNGSNATFAGTSSGTVTLIDFIDAGNVTFDTTAGVYTISDQAQLNISGALANAALANLQTIENLGNLTLKQTATTVPGTGGIALNNGGEFNVQGTGGAGTIILTALNNSSLLPGDPNPADSFAGLIRLGKKQLVLTGGMTLSTVSGDEIDFALTSPGDNGKITISGGSFVDPDSTDKTKIDFTSLGPVTAGTYDLIDFTAATTTLGGLAADPYDNFFLGSYPENVARATLQYGGPTGKILQLVAVPEPSTLMMPIVAVLGLAWLRRRATRLAV